MKLFILNGEQEGLSCELNSAGFGIGRVKSNDLVLSSGGVSRQHSRIRETPDGWEIEDLQSMNGVLVNKEKIETKYILQEGDEIKIGDTLMLFGNTPPIAAPPPAPPPPAPSAPEPSATSTPEPSATSTPEPPVPPKQDAAPPVIETPPAANADVPDYEPQASNPKPWGRIAMLAAMLVLIAILIGLLLSDPQKKEEKVVEENATTETVGEELSDEELNQLLEEEAKAIAGKVKTPSPGTATPTETGQDTEEKETPEPPRETTENTAITGIALFQTTPTGAAVFIDDKERGTTPLVISDLDKGRHRIKLTLDGYEDNDYLIHVPDSLPRRPKRMRQKVGTVMLHSVPEGASVWLGVQWLGVTPLLLKDQEEGELDLLFVLAGFRPERRKVGISKLAGEEATVELSPKVGTLQIATQPANCQILVENTVLGRTKGTAEDKAILDTGFLTLEHLQAGELEVTIKHPCGATKGGKVKIPPGKIIKKQVRLWIPNARIRFKDGSEKVGMLLEKNDLGDVVFVDSPRGRSERILKPDMDNVKLLTEDEMREEFQSLTENSGSRKNKGDSDTSISDAWGDAADNKEEKGEVKEEEAPPDEAEPKEYKRIVLKKMIADLKARNLKGKNVLGMLLEFEGVATSLSRDGIKGGVVNFGRHIKCELSKEVYEKQREKIIPVINNKIPLVIRGEIAGTFGDKIILKDCKAIFANEKEE